MPDQVAVAPPGWEKSVLRMKRHSDISNPFALAWYLKKHGAHPHTKHEAEADPDFDGAVEAALLRTKNGEMPHECTAAARGEYWAQAQLLAQQRPVVYERRW